MADNDVPITATEIAQMAGVGPSAVSNWRTRDVGFPAPIARGARGVALFSRREVTEWLRTHGYEVNELGAAERSLSLLNVLRGVLGTVAATELAIRWTAIAGTLPVDQRARLRAMAEGQQGRDALEELCGVSRGLPGHDDSAWGDVLMSSEAAAPALAAILGDMSDDERAELLDGLLRGIGTSGRQRRAQHRTDEGLAELLVDLASPSGGVVFDPAVGFGDVLRAVGDRARTEGKPAPRLVGQDLAAGPAWIATQRLALDGLEAEIRVGDALVEQVPDRGMADVVICDPPYGVKMEPGTLKATDERWFAGMPSGQAYEFAWIQHALWLTRQRSGRALVVAPLGSTFKGARANDIRRELIARGMVEAIISLPPGSAGRATGIRLAIWILRWPEPGTNRSDVIFIDGGRHGAGGKGRSPITPELRAAIARCLADGRAMAEPAELPPMFLNELEMAVRAPVDPGGPKQLLDLNPEWWVGEAAVDEFFEYMIYPQGAPEILEGISEAWRRADLSGAEEVNETDVPAPHLLGDLLAGGQVSVIRGVRLSSEMMADDGVPVVTMSGAPQRFLDPSALPADVVLTAPGDVVVHPAPRGRSTRVSLATTGGEAVAGSVICLRSASPQVPPRVLAAAIEADAPRRSPSGEVMVNYASLRWIRQVPVPRLSESEAQAAARALTSVDDLEGELESALELVRVWREVATRIVASGRVRFSTPRREWSGPDPREEGR